MALYVTEHLFPKMHTVCCAYLERRGEDIPEKIDMPEVLTYEVLGLAEEGLSKLTEAQLHELPQDIDEITTLLFVHPGVCIAVMILQLITYELL